MSTQPHRARKRFGQNFLQEPGIIQRIVRAVGARAGEHVLEVGPGQGALTEALLDSRAALTAVELDRDLVALLADRFGDRANFKLLQGDALKLNLADLSTAPVRVVGNLPYNISTPLMFHLLGQRDLIRDMHFMLQKEVVDRLAAQPGSKSWGRLGVMTQYHCRVEALFEVPPEAFSPRPKVQSAVVRLTPYPALPVPAIDEAALTLLVRTAFQQRRKTLRNALQTLLAAPDIAAVDVDPGRRPETLSLAEFVALADAYSTTQVPQQ